MATCIDITTLNEAREIEHHPITEALCVCQTNLPLAVHFSLWENNKNYTKLIIISDEFHKQVHVHVQLHEAHSVCVCVCVCVCMCVSVSE